MYNMYIYIYLKLNVTTSETCDFPVISLKRLSKSKSGYQMFATPFRPPHRSVPLVQLSEIPPEGGVPISIFSACSKGSCDASWEMCRVSTESAPPRNTRYPYRKCLEVIEGESWIMTPFFEGLLF